MKHFYYYIPPCPKCDSKRTGRYLRETKDSAQIEEMSLRHGEIVRFAINEPIDNAFCVDCGHRWPCTPKIRFLTDAQMQEQIENRTTEGAYKELKEYNASLSASSRKPPAKGIWHFFTGRK